MLKYIEGDLIKLAKANVFDVIIHGCNCQGVMGAGIAAQIKQAFPMAWMADRNTAAGVNKCGLFSLGEYVRPDGSSLLIVNAYTQHGFSKGDDVFNYDAFQFILRQIKLITEGKRIGMPMIGAGLAGGQWSEIEEIIEETLLHRDVTVVKWKP
jgi:O-acetyl-ADP-ribose deacetylase (regulator of RNase III)